MGFSWGSIFDIVAAVLPGAVGTGIRVAEAALSSGADKKTKALEVAEATLGSLQGLTDTGIIANPTFKAALGQVNDAIVYAANVAQKLSADAKTVGAGQTPPDVSALPPKTVTPTPPPAPSTGG
jgi:hypothetical protein